MGDYSVSDIYQGGYSSMSPIYGNIFGNYRVNPKSFGMTTDPRTANIIQDASTKLNVGAKHIEISAVQPDVFESIPDSHLLEMKRLSKLVGATVSVHGPILEPSGMSKDGFSETNREGVERQMLSAVKRAHIVSPDENIPVTFHSSVSVPDQITTKDKLPEETYVVNRDTGSIHRVPLKERTFPGENTKRDIKEEINKINEQQWTESLRQLEYRSQIGGEAIERALGTELLAEAEKKAGKPLTKTMEDMNSTFNQGAIHINSSYNELKELFDTAYHNASDVEKNKIEKFYKDVEERAKQLKENPKEIQNTVIMRDIIQKGVNFLNKEIVAPKLYGSLNEFSKEKTVETISNVAFGSFKEFKDKSPIISIENPPVGSAFSRGEDLKDIVEKAREKFVEKAIKPISEKGLGMSEAKAKEAAAKLIGVTWDVGHINMMRKYGYESEDIIKETEKVAKLVKHVHLSDNFGFEHTELPMGMGNVPMKEILNKLGKEGFDAKKIIEAGNWWQHFQSSPFKETLEAFGSPIYSMQMAPYWNQHLGLQQGYYSGYGAMLPQTNYASFGAGFSGLPMELGGQAPGAEGSRMSGKGME